MTLKSPYPYMGGKSRIAPMVWRLLGDCPNFVEPFFGSGACLLARPDTHNGGIETVNDLDGFIANFWRATQANPEAVAHYADWPVNENDLHARHIWLVNRRESITASLEGDPDWFDAKVAGWWVWGIACWIGTGWCSGEGPWQSVDGKLVHLGNAGRGVHRKRVHLGGAGGGVNRKLVHLGAGNGVNRKREDDLFAYFAALSDRLKRVRVCCGDWSRVCGPTPTVKQGLTGVFLDPPYSDERRDPHCYGATDSMTVAHDVRAWCEEVGDDPRLRIVLCGYDGEHNSLEDRGWRVVAWKAHGGYSSQGDGSNLNKHRERLWVSPHCLIDTLAQPALIEVA